MYGRQQSAADRPYPRKHPQPPPNGTLAGLCHFARRTWLGWGGGEKSRRVGCKAWRGGLRAHSTMASRSIRPSENSFLKDRELTEIFTTIVGEPQGRNGSTYWQPLRQCQPTQRPAGCPPCTSVCTSAHAIRFVFVCLTNILSRIRLR